MESSAAAHRFGGRRLRWAAAAFLLLLLHAHGCRTATEPVATPVPSEARPPLVAVFPVENLSGKAAPLTEIRDLFIAKLTSHGLRVVDDAALEALITKHRVRYTAGLEKGFSAALNAELGVEGVVIPSLELYDTGIVPQFGLFARYVATDEVPTVRWVDGTGGAGDDSPGILGIGLTGDPRVLLSDATERLTGSLARHLAQVGGAEGLRQARKFRPKIVYRADALDLTRRHSVVVMPFFNKSTRKYAGEIIALHMMRNLTAFPELEVVEPGVVREELLRFRIIMNDGVSLADTETILGAVNAELVLNGEVLQYQDRLGPSGTPAVDFGVLFIERRTRRVVYSAYSQNAGDDGVFFFDYGRVNTAHAMAVQMTRAIAQRMIIGQATPLAQDKMGR